MAITSLSAETLDSHILTLIDKLDHVQGDLSVPPVRLPMHVEVRRLEFWRAIIAECMATFFFVFLICAANVPWSTHTAWTSQSLYAGAFTAGFGAAALTQCFWRVSGAHMNPAVSLALAATRKISALRCLLYMTAQCGGSIAGAALLYGSSTTSLQGSLGVTVVTPPLTAWQGFGVEFVLTFVLIFVIFSVTEPSRRPLASSSLIIGFTYLTVSLAGIRCTGASVNPARSLGPAFVMNIWKDHWVYWFSPLTAAVIAAYVHEYIFNPSRRYRMKNSMDTESIAAHSDDEAFDDERPKLSSPDDYNTLRAHNYATYGPEGKPSPAGGARSVFSVPAYRVHRTESVYGGTKSLYHYSPRPSRANLARSQSVYAKESRGDVSCGGGGMTAAQSVYPHISGGAGLGHADSMYSQRPACSRPEPLYPLRREPADQRRPLYAAKEDPYFSKDEAGGGHGSIAAARTQDYVTAVTYTATSRPDDYAYSKQPNYGKPADYLKQADYGKPADYLKQADYGKPSDYARQVDYEKQSDYAKQPELYSKPSYPSYGAAAAERENAHNQRSAAGRLVGTGPTSPPYGSGYGRAGPPPPPPPPRNGTMMSPRSTLSDPPSALTTPNSIASYR